MAAETTPNKRRDAQVSFGEYDSSLTPFVAKQEAGAQAVAGGFPGGRPMVALADGRVLALDTGERIQAFPDAAILLARVDERRIVAGGDDGRVVEIRSDGAIQELGNENGRWIDAIALREDGATAWSAGKQVRARDSKGGLRSLSAPSSARGLAFLPKGYRLAISQYNGVSLWFPNLDGQPDLLKWPGSHLDLTVSPDGAFCVTAMQENALHGWRIADKKDMRMTGYPGKTRSFSFSHDGEWLATSGADACVVWPFQTKDGPMGKPPRECGVRPVKVSQVAFHPRSLVLAVGYEDGWVLMVRLDDGAELLVRAGLEAGIADGEAPREKPIVSALSWDKEGRRLLYGLETGEVGVLTLPPVPPKR